MTNLEKEKVLIIDGSSLFFRAFYALPLLKTKRGIYTNAVYGFVSMMENAIDKIKPDYLAICFDQKGPNFRHDLYEEYKGTRQKTPSELEQQWPILMEIIDLMNIKRLDSPSYEADDLAGTLAKEAKSKGYITYLLTGDRDYYQLIEEDIYVLMTKKGISQLETYDEKRIIEEYGLEPKQLIDLKGLMGDSSDNIPGVPGIGEKTGIALLKDYHSLEGVYENIDSISGKKRKENLLENETLAFLSRKLGTIITNIPLEFSLEDIRRKEYDLTSLENMFKEYEFFTLLNRLPQTELVEGEKPKIHLELMTMDKGLKVFSSFSKVILHFLGDGKIYQGQYPDYILVSDLEDQGVVIKITGIEDLQALKNLVEDKNIKKYGPDLKEALIVFLALGMNPQSFVFDSSIAEYLLDPAKSNYDFTHLAHFYLDRTLDGKEEILGKGKKQKAIKEVEEEVIVSYLSHIHELLPQIILKQEEKILDLQMEDLFQNIEMPLVEVLASMELEGMRVQEEVLDSLGEELEQELTVLTEKIYSLAGHPFNINSPKQLGVVLFEEMGLSPIKKTKTGYSTSVDVLEKLRGESEIVDSILTYRQLSKIQSTYIQGLKKIINPLDQKVHSIFQQTVTATGRISSTEPNLQNIPIKTEIGRRIRKAFIPDNGRVFIDADYSQIELRILAHISQDPVMQEAFMNEQDIHQTTASQVFHVEKSEVSPLMRSRAKAVNFGIVYGISDYGLSQDLNISRKEAREYIDNYLDKFSGVANFMKNIVKIGKEKGFVETLFHRRRYIPELSAKNYNIRAFGERVALNMPIQGTAADMIKVAMVKIYFKLKERAFSSRLLLQVHDELLIEAPQDELEEVSKLLVETMEGAMDLAVPLKVDLSIGESWYETK